MTPQININELHRGFWEQRQTRINALLKKPHLVALVARREAEKTYFVKLAMSDPVRIERIRNQKSFEAELESAAEEFASLPLVKSQRSRAKKPRGKVTDEGKTLNQVIETLVYRPEYRFSSAPDLWPHLFAELDQLGLFPIELSARILRKSAYSYEFSGKRKKISYVRFANLVSRIPKKSR